MKTIIKNKVFLAGIPSASGIEAYGNIIYIIGDDSPYLYCLDRSYRLLNKIELFKNEHFGGGRIPKKLKPDLETLTVITINARDYLLIAGSGSASNRDNAFIAEIPAAFSGEFDFKTFSFKEFYEQIRNNPELSDDKTINIEAVASDQKNIYFFKRGDNNRNNAVLMFSTRSFGDYLLNKSGLPPFQFQQYVLKGLNNLPGGFSGASVFENKLFFTASVEDTDDPVLDGEVLGSFTGYFEIAGSESKTGLLSEIKGYSIISEAENDYSGKVESVTILSKEKNSHYKALAVTDDDKGGSELLELDIII